MHRIIIRNYTKYIPSKNKTWTYKQGYYLISNKKNRSNVATNLNNSIKEFYNYKYKYRIYNK